MTPVEVDVAILHRRPRRRGRIDRNGDGVDRRRLGSTPTTRSIGGDVAVACAFIGNIVIASIGGNLYTITRANGSELGSFVEEGFQVGQRIRDRIGSIVDSRS